METQAGDPEYLSNYGFLPLKLFIAFGIEDAVIQRAFLMVNN